MIFSVKLKLVQSPIRVQHRAIGKTDGAVAIARFGCLTGWIGENCAIGIRDCPIGIDLSARSGRSGINGAIGKGQGPIGIGYGAIAIKLSARGLVRWIAEGGSASDGPIRSDHGSIGKSGCSIRRNHRCIDRRARGARCGAASSRAGSGGVVPSGTRDGIGGTGGVSRVGGVRCGPCRVLRSSRAGTHAAARRCGAGGSRWIWIGAHTAAGRTTRIAGPRWTGAHAAAG